MAGGAKVSLSMGVRYGQFKPDVPVVGRDKDKSISPRLAPSQTILLAHPDEDYWQKIVDDVSIRVLLGKAKKSRGWTQYWYPVYWLYRRLDGASR